MLKSLGSGVHADVAWVGRRLHVVLAGGVGRWLTFEEDGALVSEAQTDGRCLFPRTNGVETVYSADYQFRVWRGSVPQPAGRPAGNCPVEIGRNGTMYWQVLIDGQYRVRTWQPGGGIAHVRYGSAMGLWESDDFGHVMLWDECYRGGTRHEAGGVTVGERTDGDGCLVEIDGVARHLCPDKWVFWPRIAMREDNRIAIAWHDGKAGTGAWLWIGTPDELRALPFVPAEIPPPPVVPEIPPTQEPTMKLPADAKALIERFAAAFPLPQNEADATVWIRRMAEQLAFSFPLAGWGTKRASETRPQTKDVVCFESPFIGWDLVYAAGSPDARLILDGDSIDLTGQVYIPVTPTNHLAVEPPQPPDPELPPVPPATDLEARVAVLEQAVVNMQGFLRDTFVWFDK